MRTILIIGGGTAGWMTAALFGKLFRGPYDIELTESEAMGTVGVGLAAIPRIKKYRELVQPGETEFMRRTNATLGPGAQFMEWLRLDCSCIHRPGVVGQDCERLDCHHYWLRAKQRGRARDFADYSVSDPFANAIEGARYPIAMPAGSVATSRWSRRSRRL